MKRFHAPPSSVTRFAWFLVWTTVLLKLARPGDHHHIDNTLCNIPTPVVVCEGVQGAPQPYDVRITLTNVLLAAYWAIFGWKSRAWFCAYKLMALRLRVVCGGINSSPIVVIDNRAKLAISMWNEWCGAEIDASVAEFWALSACVWGVH